MPRKTNSGKYFKRWNKTIKGETKMKHRKLRMLMLRYSGQNTYMLGLDKIVELVLDNYARCHQCNKVFEKPSGHGAFCSQECYDKFAEDNS